jgi:uncharacterized membrane protein
VAQTHLLTKGEMMYQFVAVFVLILTTFFAGCADVTSITRDAPREVVLDSKANAYVSVPPDGHYEQQVYAGSGRIAADIVLTAFSKKMSHVDIADKKEYFEKALNHARTEGYQYLIVPKITHWEDSNAVLSGRPSKATINIRIVDVKTRDTIDSVVIDSRSSMLNVTNAPPEDALPEPIQAYVNSLEFN